MGKFPVWWRVRDKGSCKNTFVIGSTLTPPARRKPPRLGEGAVAGGSGRPPFPACSIRREPDHFYSGPPIPGGPRIKFEPTKGLCKSKCLFAVRRRRN